MEFYLHLFELFCRPGDTVYSVFNGTKILCAGLISTNFTFIPTVAILVLSLLPQTFGCLGSTRAELVVLCYFSSSRADVICSLIL